MYAHWQDNTPPAPTQYTITFCSTGGSPVGAITQYVGTQVVKPANPTRAGYTFLGWFSAPNGGIPYVWPYTVTGNVTMYAQWQDNTQPAPTQYTVTFSSMGGSSVGAITQNTGTQVAQPADPTWAGYTFLGWFSAPNGGIPYVWPYTVTGNVTMYAQWTVTTYTITFDSHEGSPVGAITANTGAQVAKPADSLRADYTFNGWYNAANGGTAYTWPYTLTGNVTMHAQWTAIYTIIFDSHDGSTVAPVTVNAGTPIPKPADPMKTGYTFLGWFNTASGGTAYTWPHTLNGNTTMHAQWTAISYNITYNNLNGASNPNPANYTIENSAISLAPLTHAYYQFEGWYENAAFSGTPVTSIPASSMGIKTFYAKWHAPASIQITLQPAPSDPLLTGAIVPVNQQATFNAEPGYADYAWHWDGAVISEATSYSYTLTANSKPAGIYELSVVVTNNDGERLSARCRVTITAQ
jgi:uncharacterized repeat protein (TIGR02543 family)